MSHNELSYAKYFMEFEYLSPSFAGNENKNKKVVFRSDECFENCICPTFELQKQNVRASKEFIKNFEKINSFDVIIRLKSKSHAVETHEFKIDFSNL